MTQESFTEEYERFAEHFVHTLETASSFKEVVSVCAGYYLSTGVKMCSYHHLPPVGAVDHAPSITVFSHGFPEKWTKKYLGEKLYNVNPFPKYALVLARPFWWSEMFTYPNMTSDEKNYIALLREADLGEGIAIPVFGPNGRNGYVGLGFGSWDVEVSDLKISRFQSAAQLGHQRYCRLLGEKKKEDVSLSDREREILEWVVRGKSNSVIADIVGISNYTVDTYLRRIFAKLGVSSRVTAALRGLSIGVVS